MNYFSSQNSVKPKQRTKRRPYIERKYFDTEAKYPHLLLSDDQYLDIERDYAKDAETKDKAQIYNRYCQLSMIQYFNEKRGNFIQNSMQEQLKKASLVTTNFVIAE